LGCFLNHCAAKTNGKNIKKTNLLTISLAKYKSNKNISTTNYNDLDLDLDYATNIDKEKLTIYLPEI